MSEVVTQAEFARRMADRMGRTVARSTVKRWADAGKIVMTASGQVELEASIARLETLGVGQLRPDVAARHRAEAGEDAAARPKPGPAADDLAAPQRRAHREQALHWDNELARLRLALQSGDRLIAADVRREAFTLGNLVRAELERLVDQAAPTLAVSADPALRRDLLTQEIARVRRVIKRAFPAALRRLRDQARDASL